ncbi:gamma-aminobutyrate permease-like transporter [Caldisphaera lagunensis DSM 15908]|uniref:Gamma-aminobutyrate permease-like transporter n=1 Tax=Caldisphaera lagunensis (strain DSM 15908 / JCM 11604 / ANMR 0165 / IC-154) TaxID=1056495 RepID=L0AA84_CALLD|nr:APC family permease [Caldisphaera lagunensis]AFZ69955.1 gamma-aminobutyrate permease-like transporter [Caldisphaera lagunensis DSM 15908]
MGENSKGASLRKELSFLEIFIAGLVGAVGTGILFSPAGMAGYAGPSIIISWILGGIFYTFVSIPIIELELVWPEAGGPARYPLYTHGNILNLISSFMNLVWYLFIPPIEALATVEGLAYFFPNLLVPGTTIPTVLGAIVGTLLLLLFVPFNYFGVKAFGRTTLGLGLIKLIIYIVAALSIAVVFFSPGNFIKTPGGFAPFGFSGIFLAIPLAMFAYGGIRVIPDFAEEVKDKSFLGKAILLTVLGQTIIYILFSIVFIGGLNWSALGIKFGDWSSVSSLPGNPFIDISSSLHSKLSLLLVLIVAILGPFVTGYIYLGSGTRVVFAISRSGYMPDKLKEVSATYAIPYWALIIFAIVGAILTFLTAPIHAIYSLLEDAVVGGYLAFATLPVTMMAARKKNITPKNYRLPLGWVWAVLAFISSSLIAFWSGWPSVPYAIAIGLIASIVFGLIFKVKGEFRKSIWYIVYLIFILIMTYIGSDGALSIIGFIPATIIVAVVSVLVFLPWGVYS